MGPGDVMAFAALMMTIVAVFVLITSTYKRRIDYKLRSLELKSRAGQQRVTTEPSEAFKQLEKRVRVLERIATDRAPDLASQIEALRDHRRVEELLEAREAEKSQ